LNRKRRRWKALGAVLVGLAIGAVVGVLLVWTGRAPVPMTGNCIKGGCHNAVNKQAAIYVAVDQEELSPVESVTVAAGTSFELDFYFEDMVGMKKRFPIFGRFFDAEPYTTVGMELVVGPGWDVSVGTIERPEGWSRVWQRGASGIGEQRITSWQPAKGAEGRYYLDFRASPWAANADLPAVAADRGNETAQDLDGIAERMGADAVVLVPSTTPNGQYEVVVAGVGHSSGGKKAHVSQTIIVNVVEAELVEAGPAPPEGARLYAQLCLSCHEDTPREKGTMVRWGTDWTEHVINWGTGHMRPVRGLDEPQVAAIVNYVEGTAAPVERPIPLVPHAAEYGQVCQACHGPGEIRPAPAGHASFSDLICLDCHQVSEAVAGIGVPEVPHPGGERPCLNCHGPAGPAPVSVTHQGRGNDICAACHQVTEEMAVVEVPNAPHRVSASGACSTCHGFSGPIPMSKEHAERGDMLCVACHDANATAIAATPVIPHSSEGREACLACHSPAGWVPAPDDHWERPENTCLVCH
jgi:mono/diheme cytochrome c family protein